MDFTYKQCPKCGYEPLQDLPASAKCPACGIYFFKWVEASHTSDLIKAEDETYVKENIKWITIPFQPLDNMGATTFYGRFLALLILAVWSWFLFSYDYRDGEIGTSFMHDILLPIHEAGHVFFRPFGEFMMILGGSLFQLLLPLGITFAFIAINRDNFGGAISLWWTGVSLLDLSPYVYDALQPQLTLIGGRTGAEGPHDWIYLLTSIGQLGNSQHWGSVLHTSGGLLMVLTLIWAVILLWRQHIQLNKAKR